MNNERSLLSIYNIHDGAFISNVREPHDSHFSAMCVDIQNNSIWAACLESNLVFYNFENIGTALRPNGNLYPENTAEYKLSILPDILEEPKHAASYLIAHLDR